MELLAKYAGSPTLDSFHGFMDSKLRMDFEQKVNMIRHDFHFDDLDLDFFAD